MNVGWIVLGVCLVFVIGVALPLVSRRGTDKTPLPPAKGNPARIGATKNKQRQANGIANHRTRNQDQLYRRPVDELKPAAYRQQQQIDRLINEFRSLRDQVQATAPAEQPSLRDELPPHY